MEKVQLLNSEQVEGLVNIIYDKYLSKIVADRLLEIRSSEEYITIYNELKNSTEYVKSIAEANQTNSNNYKVRDLLRNLKELDEGTYRDSKLHYHWISDASDEEIEEAYKLTLGNIDRNIMDNVDKKMNIDPEYCIQQSLETELTARLLLTAISDFDTIIKCVLADIKIDNHIFNK